MIIFVNSLFLLQKTYTKIEGLGQCKLSFRIIYEDPGVTVLDLALYPELRIWGASSE